MLLMLLMLFPPVLCREEVFGPVMTLVRFQTDAEAVALANDSAFGLGSNVFCSNRQRANTIARQLQVGLAVASPKRCPT